MVKRLFLGIMLSVCTVALHAQWTRQDSIRLQELLQTEGEIRLNPDAVKSINMGQTGSSPIEQTENTLDFDDSLPEVFPGRIKSAFVPGLYSGIIPYNHDPVHGKKKKLGMDTWEPKLLMGFIYSNWAKKPFDGGERKSLEEIEATGMRYNILANGGQGAWEPTSAGPLGSLDLMAPFTKDFWDKKGRKRRARTMEVLSLYGDSTTVTARDAIIKPITK